MTAQLQKWFSSDDIDLLTALADVIVPRYRQMPAASDIGLCADHIWRTFEIRPDLIELVRLAIEFCRPLAQADALPVLSQAHPDLLSALMQAVAGTYYMQPTVKALMGYAGQNRLL